MHRLIVVAVVAPGLATLVHAQASISVPSQRHTGVPAVDSAQEARAAWGRANSALRASDLPRALAEVDRAAAAWPTQPAYTWARAVLAAQARDTAAMRSALLAYAALGLGRDLGNDSVFRRYTTLPEFASIVAAHAANSEPYANSTVRLTLPDSTFWPEGADYDRRTDRFYVASVRHRTIAEVGAHGAYRELWSRDRPDMGAVLGVRVDTARGVLWATMAAPPTVPGDPAGDSTIAALVRVRIADGAIERRWNIAPVPLGHTLGDLAIGPRGDVFVTDSREPVLYRLRPGSDTLERITNALFRSLQGVAPTTDGRVLYMSDYSHGLLRVDLVNGDIVRLTDAPNSTSLGCDGIVWDERARAIIAVQNGVSPARVMRFVLDATGRRIARAELLDRHSNIADEPTIGTIVDRAFVYVANSQWDKFDDTGRLNPGAHLTAPILLAVPLPP